MSSLPILPKTFLFDTSAIALAGTVTLASGIGTSDTAIAVSGTTPPINNGIYLKILAEGANSTEIVYVTAGGGTTGLTITRAQLGTAASAHGSGATVNVPGAMVKTLWQIAAGPNRALVLRNATANFAATNLGYVLLTPYGAETLPGGATQHILPDSSTDLGTLVIQAPGAGGTEWILLSSAGTQGLPGAPGAPGGGATPAPGVATATGAITGYQQDGNAAQPVFGGVITLAVSDPNYSHDKFVEVKAIRPDGARIQLDGCIFTAPFTGGTITYSGTSPAILQTTSAQTGWGLEITPLNEDYEPGTPYIITGLTIAAAGITALSATDDTADRWQDEGGALHAVVPITISCSSYPQTVSICYKSPQYGTLWQGWFLVLAANTVINLGAKPGTALYNTAQPTGVYPPTVAAETVTIYAVIGTYGGSADPTALPGVASCTVNVSAPAAMTGSSSSSASASVSYYTASGGASDFLATILFTLNLQDPNFFFARLYVQTGAGTGGAFVPGGAHPGYHSADGTIGDWCSPTAFVSTPDHGPGFSLVSTVAAGQIKATVIGPVPTDGNSTLRFSLDVASRLDDGSGGTKVLQYTWAGGASYRDVVVDPTKGQVQGTQISDLGPGLTTAPSLGTPGNYSSLAQGPPQLTVASGFLITSALMDPSFYGIGSAVKQGLQSAAIDSTINGHWAWSTFCDMSGGSIAVIIDGGSDDAFCIKVTGGPEAGLQQPISVTPGQTLCLSAMVQSNNPSLSGGQTHGLIYQVFWYDASFNYLGYGAVATATGYIAAWELLSGFVTAPANAAYMLVFFCTSPGEAPTGSWLIDTLHVQNVVQQTGNAQTTSMAPESTPDDYTALRVLSTANAGTSQWGLALAGMTYADGSFAQLSVGTASAGMVLAAQGGAETELVSTSSASTLELISPNSQEIFEATAPNSGVQLSVLKGGAPHIGTTETLAAAIAAGRHVVAGLIVP